MAISDTGRDDPRETPFFRPDDYDPADSGNDATKDTGNSQAADDGAGQEQGQNQGGFTSGVFMTGGYQPAGQHDDAAADDDAPYVRSSEPSASEQPRQLDLGEEDVRLPWLEGDDEEFEDDGGAGIGQGVLLVLLGLVALGLIVGSLFWAMRHNSDKPLVADGGVIAAPKEPYKVRPDNPGGEVVAGTGDTSFAVAEGQSRSPQIGGKEEAPGPGFESVAKPGASASNAPASASAPAQASGGTGVQVGAYTSRDAAEAGWNALKSQYPGLAGVGHRIVQGQADIGTVYRLQAVAGNAGAAKELCNGMKSAGLSCQVKN